MTNKKQKLTSPLSCAFGTIHSPLHEMERGALSERSESKGGVRFWIFVILIFFGLSSTSAVFAAAGSATIEVTIDGNTFITGDPIDSTPSISMTIVSPTSLSALSITIGTTTTNLSSVRSGSTSYATHEVTSALSNGIHIITIEATNSVDTTVYELNPLYIYSASDAVIPGSLLNHPNPYDPGNGNTTIAYSLSKPSNIVLRIFDLTGRLIWSNSYASGATGGRAGYNAVTWSGQSSGGTYVGNGIYIMVVFADGKKVQNGVGKITIFKQ